MRFSPLAPVTSQSRPAAVEMRISPTDQPVRISAPYVCERSSATSKRLLLKDRNTSSSKRIVLVRSWFRSSLFGQRTNDALEREQVEVLTDGPGPYSP
jgi:hypothetical protein